MRESSDGDTNSVSIHLHEVLEAPNPDTESGVGLSGGGEEENGALLLSGDRISIFHATKKLELGCTAVSRCLTLLNWTLRND